MKTILLKERTEAADLVIPILPDIDTDRDEPHIGCTCDRWGHPCADSDESKAESRRVGIAEFNKKTK